MGRTNVMGEHQRREKLFAAGSLASLRSTLAPYQTRTCARCGRSTTFVLEDAAGGWYACIECGRYA
jgi:PHP family Zn ribbon phosphoesterase